MLQVIQVAMNTSDMAGSLRLYSECLGFSNAGGQGLWGETIKIQGLPADARALMWWMVGAQSLFQLEFFHHSAPVQRPIPPDWRPCDHGWVRVGIVVTDFDRSIAALDKMGIALLAEPTFVGQLRRVTFRDPYSGALVEVFEDGPDLPGGGRRVSSACGLVYATASVGDLAGARAFYTSVMGLKELPLATLHTPEHEACWGLAGAEREGFVLEAGGILVEILRYSEPSGRPRRSDYRVSDQSMVNVAFGSRDYQETQAAIERVIQSGVPTGHIVRDGGVIAAYFTAPEREIELLAVPEDRDAYLGFIPITPFFG